MDRRSPTPVVKLAESQHGVVTRAQLVGLGVSVGAIDSRVRRRALRLLYPGVYALAHTALREEGRWLAAVLACGPGAVLSHVSAARLWRMRVDGRERSVHVSTPADRRPAGLVVHRTRRLGPADVTRERGVPVTTPARTIVDVADVLAYGQVRSIVDRGVRLDAGALRRARDRAPGRRGAATIARLLGEGDLRTRSRLERRLRRICRDAGLPAPRVNERVLGRERDAVWPEHRLVVEVDGHTYHAPRPAREDDHDRDAELVLAGWRVVRFTDDQIYFAPADVAARLAALLADPRPGERETTRAPGGVGRRRSY